jgi:SH3-like domain-containing protein
MKTLLAAVVIVVALATPSHAAYTECTVQGGTDPLNRPGGNSDPRWRTLDKGTDVAIRDTYQNWVFVTFFDGDHMQYGWVQRSALANCRAKEGTP